jgi:anti-sigma factor RsiW
MQAAQSVWTGLELDLVKSSGDQSALPLEPKPQAAPRIVEPPKPSLAAEAVRQTRSNQATAQQSGSKLGRSGMAVLGLALIVAAAGTIYRFIAPGSERTVAEAPPPDATLAAIKGVPPVDFVTDDSQALSNWFTAQTGTDFPMLPTPEGYMLAGGSIEHSGYSPTAVAVYARNDDVAELTITPVADDPTLQQTLLHNSDPAGKSNDIFRWQKDGFSYALTGDGVDTRLNQFKAP